MNAACQDTLHIHTSIFFFGLAGDAKKVLPMSGPPSTPFKLERSFPNVIITYSSKTDGGRGEERMWQVANFLKKNGITSFNGKQVEAGQDWMQKWLGKMPEADVCLAMISGPYFESAPCKEEIYKTAREKIPILPIIFETPPPLKKGFFGMSDDEREKGNFVRGELHNWLPTPDQGLFQDNWEANCAELLAQVKKYVAASEISAPPEHGVSELKIGAGPLPGGLAIGDKIYFTGEGQTFPSGNRLAHGALGEVTGPAVDKWKDDGVLVMFPGNSGGLNLYVSTLSTNAPPPLNGGFKGGDKVYFTGDGMTFPSGNKLTYGALGEVTGPAVDQWKDEGVKVLFPGNSGSINVYISTVSKDAPPPLPGGFKAGDKVYYTGDGMTFESGNKLTNGGLGEVTGPAVEQWKETGVKVMFEGNSASINLYVSTLSKDAPPPIPGGLKVGDSMYFTGEGMTFPSGNRLVYGALGKVTGPAVGQWKETGVQVMFEGNSASLNLYVNTLSKTPT